MAHRELVETGTLGLAQQLSESLPDTITVLLFCEFSNQLRVYKSRIIKIFLKTSENYRRKGTAIKTLQLKYFIPIDPLAKYFFTAVYARDQFLTRAEERINKGLFIINNQPITMPASTGRRFF